MNIPTQDAVLHFLRRPTAEREMPALLRVVEAARRLAQWRNERGSITAGVVIGGHAWDELAAALAALDEVTP